MTHTKTPWQHERTETGLVADFTIYDDEGYPVAFVRKEDQAAFIVRACNSHDELLEAAQLGKNLGIELLAKSNDGFTPEQNRMFLRIKEIIAKTEGSSSLS